MLHCASAPASSMDAAATTNHESTSSLPSTSKKRGGSGIFRVFSSSKGSSQKRSTSISSSQPSTPLESATTTASASLRQRTVSLPSDNLQQQSEQQQAESAEEERRELIERAASERDEKRKKKVYDALQSTQRRLDAASNAIQAEMEDNLETSAWTEAEKKWGLLVVLLITLAYNHTGIVSYLACLALLTYSYRQRTLKQLDARRAGDNVVARLADVEDGLRRCELALQHDVEQEEEWAQMLVEENRLWEERERELLLRRGRVFPITQRALHSQRVRMVTQFHETTDRAMQVMHKIEDVARKTLKAVPHPTAAVTRESADSEIATESGELAPTPAWRQYVQTNLPLERLAEESEEERVFSAQLRLRSNGTWDALPKDIQLMLLRGYADKKDRMKESLDAIAYILDWRAKTQCDTGMLTRAEPEYNSFCRAWGTVFAGEDRYGHIIIADRVETIDLPALFLLEDEEILLMRTKQMEVLRRLKHSIEQRRGHRVCKHIYILDLAGLNVRKHFTPRVKNILQSIFKVGGDAYPDSMWQMWLINTPFVFQLIWKALSPTIDPTTKSKIRMMGGKDKYLSEMLRCGIPLSSIPIEFGGEFPTRNFFSGLEEIMREDEAAKASAKAKEEEEERV